MKIFRLPAYTGSESLLRRLMLNLLFALSLMAVVVSARAHDPGLSIATANIDGNTLSIQLTMARSDAEQLVSPEQAQLDRRAAKISSGAIAELQGKVAGSFEIASGGIQLKPASASVMADNKNGVIMELSYAGLSDGPLTVRSAWLGSLARGHRQYFTLHDQQGKLAGESMLDAAHNDVTVAISAVVITPVARHSFQEFLSLGVMHIATGYDHQLFLLGLLMVGGSLRSALKIITSFTVAHSITLALTALHVIHLPSALVEPLIAASIVYVGLENLLRRGTDKRWILTFCFGLVHGCGFASALQDLGVGANGTPILLPLVSFNLGVEAGQLIIAAIVLPIIWKCQASPRFVRQWVPVASTAIVLLGGFWFLQRTVL